MNIVVFGATGGTGQEFVKQALNEGHEITAILRNPAALDLQHFRLHKVAGDALKPNTFAHVLEGKEAVVSTLGISSLWKSLRPMTFHRQTMRNLIDQMQRAHVQRLLCVTSTGVVHNPTAPRFYNLLVQPLLRHKYEDMRIMEDEVRQSALRWTVVRPFRLTKEPRTRRYRVATDGMLESAGTIARADVADLLLRALDDNQYVHQTVAIAY